MPAMSPVAALLIIASGLAVFLFTISRRIRPLLYAGNVVGQGYLLAKDLIDVAGTLGAGAFLYFRLIEKKERMTLSWEGVFILCMIIGVLWTDLLIDGSALAASGAQRWYFPV